MKKKYTTPYVELSALNIKDIITLSVPVHDDNGSVTEDGNSFDSLFGPTL